MDSGLEYEVRELLRRGEKIEAVKRVREVNGLGLKEALEYVEALERGNPLVGTPTPQLSDLEIEQRTRDFVRQGKVIEAIKFVREATGSGLKEAKDYVDYFVKENR